MLAQRLHRRAFCRPHPTPALHKKAQPLVIPGRRRKAANPEAIFQRLVFMTSGFAAQQELGQRPGMTMLCKALTPARF
jgi:hypothetical protein